MINRTLLGQKCDQWHNLFFWFNSMYFSNWSFRFLEASLLLVAIHIDRQEIGKNNIAPKMETNHTIIFYASLRIHRLENCWGEGEHATLRSTISTSCCTDEDHIRRTRRTDQGRWPCGGLFGPLRSGETRRRPHEDHRTSPLGARRGPCTIWPMR
jgi:hypothetical protein